MFNIKNTIISKININALFISLVIFFITIYTDTIIFKDLNVENYYIYLPIKFIALVFLVLMGQIIQRTIKKIKEKNYNTTTFIKYFGFYFFISLFVLVLVWPGIWRNDEFYIFNDAINLDMNYWQHSLTSLFYMFSLSIIPFPVGIVIFQIFFISLIVGYVITQFNSLFPSKYNFLLIVPFLLPSFITYNLSPLRLTLYSYLELLLFSSIIFKYLKINKIGYKHVISWGILTSVIGCWRSESLFCLIFVPIMIVVIFDERINYKQILTFVFTMIVFSTSIIAIQNTQCSQDYYQYLLSGELVPLSKIIQNNPNIEKKDYDMIDKIVSVKSLKESSDWPRISSNVNHFYLTENYMSDFEKLYFKLIKNNLGFFVKERFFTFLQSQDVLTVYRDVFKSPMYNEYLFSNKPINSSLRLSVIQVLDGLNVDDKGVYISNYMRRILYNPCVALILAVILFNFCIFSKLKKISIIPIILILQTLIILLSSPAVIFMYYVPINICGYVFMTMILLRFLSQKLPNMKNKIQLSLSNIVAFIRDIIF